LEYTVTEGIVVVKVDGVVVDKVSGNLLDALSDGLHTVQIEATDAANNLGYAEATFMVDTVAPTASITSPSIGTTSNYAPMLTYIVSDGTVVVKVDGIVVNKVSGSAIDTLSAGSHTVHVEVTDAAGNTGFAEVTFTILDTTAPLVSITSPFPGTTNISTPLLTYTISDGTVIVTVDGTVVNKISGNMLDMLTAGNHTVRVEATDVAGNTGFAEVIFTVSDDAIPDPDASNVYCNGTEKYLVGPSSFANGISIPPSGTNAVWIASPANGATINGPRTIVKGAMDTTIPVKSVMVVVSGGTGTIGYAAQVNGKYFAAQIPVTADINTISAIATDQTGAQHQASVSVTVTTQPDNVNLLASPNVGIPTLKENGQTLLDVSLMSTTTITIPVRSYAWDFNGSDAIALTCYSHSNVTASYQQTGLYLTTVTVADAAGNHFTDTTIVNVVDGMR
jgi:hypothetical protein